MLRFICFHCLILRLDVEDTDGKIITCIALAKCLYCIRHVGTWTFIDNNKYGAVKNTFISILNL